MTDDTYRWKSVTDATIRESHRFVTPVYPERIKAWDIGIEPPQITVIKHRSELVPQNINAQYGKYAQMIGRGDRRPAHYTTGWSDDMRLHYRVWQEDGGKFITKLYSDGFLCRVLRSKRRKLAIGKGQKWTHPSSD